MAHSPPQKKQQQGKTQVKYCTRTAIQYLERTHSRSYTVWEKVAIEMPLAITLAGIKTSARKRHFAAEWSYRLFQEQMTEGKCDLKYFVDISAASVLDLVSRGRAEESAATCEHLGTTM